MRVNANTLDHVGVEPRDRLSRNLDWLLDSGSMSAVREALASPDPRAESQAALGDCSQ